MQPLRPPQPARPLCRHGATPPVHCHCPRPHCHRHPRAATAAHRAFTIPTSRRCRAQVSNHLRVAAVRGLRAAPSPPTRCLTALAPQRRSTRAAYRHQHRRTATTPPPLTRGLCTMAARPLHTRGLRTRAAPARPSGRRCACAASRRRYHTRAQPQASPAPPLHGRRTEAHLRQMIPPSPRCRHSTRSELGGSGGADPVARLRIRRSPAWIWLAALPSPAATGTA